MFISFEGIDGSGKTTQARMLAEAMRAGGQEVVLTREPGGSDGAEAIRRLLVEGGAERWSPETEILLFNAARRDHLERTIRPALDRGAVVITDRFADSTRVYQGVTRGDLSAMVETLHQMMIGIEPARTFVIDIDPAEGLARSLARQSAMQAAQVLTAPGLRPAAAAMPVTAEDRFESMGAGFQAQLRAGFAALAAAAPERVRLIDGNGPADEVAARVRAAL
ncbi:MAG: dTMP kinase [Paracoccus sp. (in: a-proteobacteria)]|nr:dTMP kinase [Paracoccus sp. (in: a-proteobacteria)]